MAIAAGKHILRSGVSWSGIQTGENRKSGPGDDPGDLGEDITALTGYLHFKYLTTTSSGCILYFEGARLDI
jgi:hypothetical protein